MPLPDPGVPSGGRVLGLSFGIDVMRFQVVSGETGDADRVAWQADGDEWAVKATNGADLVEGAESGVDDANGLADVEG